MAYQTRHLNSIGTDHQTKMFNELLRLLETGTTHQETSCTVSTYLNVCFLLVCQKKQDNKAPDKDAILKATAGLSTRHTDRTVTQHNIRDVSTAQYSK